jgi:hypothetical protein
MNRRIPSLWNLLLAAALTLFPVSLGLAQSEAESADKLAIQYSPDTTRMVVIDSGDGLRVWTTEGKLHQGKLRGVTDSSLFVWAAEIPFSETAKIALEEGGGDKSGGLVVLILGGSFFLLALIFGIIAGIAAADLNNGGFQAGCAIIFLLFACALLGTTALILLIIGGALYLAGKAVGRSFQFPGKWRLKRIKGK